MKRGSGVNGYPIIDPIPFEFDQNPLATWHVCKLYIRWNPVSITGRSTIICQLASGDITIAKEIQEAHSSCRSFKVKVILHAVVNPVHTTFNIVWALWISNTNTDCKKNCLLLHVIAYLESEQYFRRLKQFAHCGLSPSHRILRPVLF